MAPSCEAIVPSSAGAGLTVLARAYKTNSDETHEGRRAARRTMARINQRTVVAGRATERVQRVAQRAGHPAATHAVIALTPHRCVNARVVLQGLTGAGPPSPGHARPPRSSALQLYC